MEPMVIYFILRKISDWSLTHFYSEVHVLGRENVPADGPLLICANHHNEIIDIATLAATIPHRRQVGFWAKSSMFKNPIARFILLSSGSIPVKRSPNGVKEASSTVAPANESLFASTSRSLARPRSRGGLLNYVTGVFPDRVVGVFPEGTSYTEPQIMQVKEGAAWAALEYAKWQAENGAQDSQAEKLALVPVGIVYTDKSQYLSDISVVYGKPIRLEQVTADYIAASSANDKEKAHLAISALTATVKQKLLKLSVNAPDWETLYSADLARDIIWTGSHNTAELARISQAFVDIFSESYGPNVDSDSLSRTRATLLRYAGLLHYSGLRHCGLASLSRTTTKSQALVSASYHTLTTVSHPQFPLFFPVFVLHAPGYLLGLLAARVFGNPKLPETLAQFKVIFGGVGFGISYSICGHALTRWTMRLGSIASIPVAGIPAVDEVLRALARVGYLVQGGDGMWGRLRGGFSMAVILWLMTNALAKWHQILVKSNYTRFRRVMALWKIASGLLLPASLALEGSQLQPYVLPPAPAPSPFVRYPPEIVTENALQSSAPEGARILRAPRVPSVSSVRLVRPLLHARAHAMRSLKSYLGEIDKSGVGREAFGPRWGNVARRADDLA